MGFFSPWFLAGLAALGLPLWLHLLRRYRRTPRPFSSLMFFERRTQSSSKHRRLRYLALLATRLALLALLALAFANPFITESVRSEHLRSSEVIAVDRSFSMRTGGRIEAAKRAARQAVANLSGSASGQVIAFDSKTQALTDWRADKAAMTAAIETIAPGDEVSSYGALTRSLRVLQQSLNVHLNVTVITDAQQSSMPAEFKDVDAGPQISLRIVPVAIGQEPNWAVENVNVPAQIYTKAPDRITASVVGWGTPAATRRVALEIDGHEVASRDVAIPANGRAPVEFQGFEVTHGPHRGVVKIGSYDSLAADDSFNFSLTRSDPRPVLVLYCGGRSKSTLYYRAAIDSGPGAGLSVTPFPLERIADQDLTRYAYVVLNDGGGLTPAASQQLQSYLEKGGGVFIAVGQSTRTVGRIPLTESRVTGTLTMQRAGQIDRQSHALANTGAFENVSFAAAAQITPGPGDRVLAHLAEGSPLLVEHKTGEGRILIFAAAIDNSDSDFPLHASYVPFVGQTGRYLAGAEDDPSSVVVGSPVRLRRAKDRRTATSVLGPDGRQLFGIGEGAKASTFSPQTEGFYDVTRAGAGHVLVAVHADRRESDLRTLSPETLDLWRDTGTSSSERVGSEERTVARRGLWRYLMTLALLAALAESIFGARYLSGERQVS